MPTKKPRILAFAGSTRQGSFNKKLIQVAAHAAEQAGAEVTLLDLADYSFPIYNADLEEQDGLPEKVKELKQLFLDHEGLLIASPEYNSSITPLLKNTIDWVSRPAEGEGRLAAYQDKVASLMAASPGGLGGLRGLVHLRAILQNIGVTVLPDQHALSSANKAFDDNGQIKDDKTKDKIESLGTKLTNTLEKLSKKD